jgi:hypothetical protein
MRWRPIFLLLVLGLGVVVWSAATCFPRQCDSSANCLKSCRCEDKSRNEIIDCPLFFMCDTEAGVCEDAYNMSCDEFCSTFAARGACGSKRCDDEDDCVRETTCQAEVSGQEPVPYSCAIRFTCEENEGGVCSTGYELDDPTFCTEFGPACLQAQAAP